jgi:hypothetical protein
MGREAGCVGVGVAFSALADAESGVLPGRFLEDDPTEANAGAMTTRGEETGAEDEA